LGRGTTFTVLLPSGAVPVAPPAAPPAPAETTQGIVLVIDDEPIVRGIARRALERAGFEVLDAEDGDSGLAVLRQRAADLSAVLLDVNMPGLGCEQILDAIRATAPGVPVLLSSGYTETESVSRFARYGIAGFLQKPYTAQRLNERIAAA